MTGALWEDPSALWADPVVVWTHKPDWPTDFTSVKQQGFEPLTGARVTSFRLDVLDHSENVLGYLTSAEVKGSLTWDANAAIKGNGKITVQDVTDPNIRWDQIRLRPWIIQEYGDQRVETPLGVFLCSTPIEQWSDAGLSWEVELLDKNSILDQDIPEDPDTGQPWHYSALSGSNLRDHILAVIGETGEDTPAIKPDSQVTPNYMFWDIGTTRLKIVNDLLQIGGYMPLWTDGMGQFRVTPYVSPKDRSPVYDLLAPLGDGPNSIQVPDWKRELDWYAIPNRYVAYKAGDGSVPPGTPGNGQVGIATNEDPDDPLGFVQRGRWVTVTETEVEASDLNLYAQMQLDRLRSVGAVYSITHAFLPDLRVNSVVRYVHAEADVSTLCLVLTTDVPLDPLGLCQTTMLEIGPTTRTATLTRATAAWDHAPLPFSARSAD